MIFLAFLVPLATYCAFLGYLNRRRHPVLIAGTWDAVSLLLAVSGFLLLGGPAILSGLYDDWRMAWLLGRARIFALLLTQWPVWIGLWGIYFALIVVGAGLFIWWRRNVTSVYNVDLNDFEDALAQALDRLGYEAYVAGVRRLVVRARGAVAVPRAFEPAGLREAGVELTAWAPPEAGAQLGWDPFPLMRHVTLYWQAGAGALRAEVESELARLLAQVRTRHNPLGTWFLTASSALFFFCLAGLVTFVTLRLLHLLH